MPLYKRRRLAELYPKTDHWRPAKRADCQRFPRPCPYVGCRYHLFLDVRPGGNIKYNFPDLDVEQLEQIPASCALDVADLDGVSYYQLGALMNVSRARIGQILDATTPRLKLRLIRHLGGAP